MLMPEGGIPSSPGDGFGRVWVKSTTPAELWYTDDAGSHFQLGTGGTGGLLNVLEDATPELGGALGCLDEQVQRAEILDYAITSTSPASAAGAIEFNCEAGNAFEVELTEDIDTVTLSNPPASGKYGEITIKFKQDSTGGWNVTSWPASVKWAGGIAPTLTATLTTGVDLLHLATWDGGAIWYATVAQDFS
jgi:hypothetical protein